MTETGVTGGWAGLAETSGHRGAEAPRLRQAKWPNRRSTPTRASGIAEAADWIAEAPPPRHIGIAESAELPTLRGNRNVRLDFGRKMFSSGLCAVIGVSICGVGSPEARAHRVKPLYLL